MDVLFFVVLVFLERTVATGQDALAFAQGVATVLAQLKIDAETRIAALLFELPVFDSEAAATIDEKFGLEVADLVAGIRQLMRLHEMTFGLHDAARGKSVTQQAGAQVETLRKMLLAMASDMRVVLVRLVLCVTFLRYFAEEKLQNEMTHRYARETFD